MDINDKKDQDAWQRRFRGSAEARTEESRARTQHANGELFQAIEYNDLNGVSTWLARGADPNARRGSRMETPLLVAVEFKHGDPRIAELLVDRARNVHARDADGKTPLHYAASRGNGASLVLLLDRRAEIDSRDDFGRTPLHDASEHSRFRQMEFLLSRGADVSARTKTGETPLHLAAPRGEEEHIRVLLDHGADIDARDATGDTPLHKAAVPPRLAQLEFLITVGADVNARDGIGQTPLDILRGLRANPEWCKKSNTLLESLRDPQWQMLREVLGGFTTVKVTDVWQDSVIVRVEGHHGRYSDALREAQSAGRSSPHPTLFSAATSRNPVGSCGAASAPCPSWAMSGSGTGTTRCGRISISTSSGNAEDVRLGLLAPVRLQVPPRGSPAPPAGAALGARQRARRDSVDRIPRSRREAPRRPRQGPSARRTFEDCRARALLAGHASMLAFVRTPAKIAPGRGVSRFLRLVADSKICHRYHRRGLPHREMKSGVLFPAPVSVTPLVIPLHCMGRELLLGAVDHPGKLALSVRRPWKQNALPQPLRGIPAVPLLDLDPDCA